MVARGPFLIGVQGQGGRRKRYDPLIHVDLDHPRVSFTEGESVFLPQGGNSRLLDHVAAILRGIHEGAGRQGDVRRVFTDEPDRARDAGGEGDDEQGFNLGGCTASTWNCAASTRKRCIA